MGHGVKSRAKGERDMGVGNGSKNGRRKWERKWEREMGEGNGVWKWSREMREGNGSREMGERQMGEETGGGGSCRHRGRPDNLNEQDVLTPL